jgi:hypothetical protein
MINREADGGSEDLTDAFHTVQIPWERLPNFLHAI